MYGSVLDPTTGPGVHVKSEFQVMHSKNSVIEIDYIMLGNLSKVHKEIIKQSVKNKIQTNANI